MKSNLQYRRKLHIFITRSSLVYAGLLSLVLFCSSNFAFASISPITWIDSIPPIGGNLQTTGQGTLTPAYFADANLVRLTDGFKVTGIFDYQANPADNSKDLMFTWGVSRPFNAVEPISIQFYTRLAGQIDYTSGFKVTLIALRTYDKYWPEDDTTLQFFNPPSGSSGDFNIISPVRSQPAGNDFLGQTFWVFAKQLPSATSSDHITLTANSIESRINAVPLPSSVWLFISSMGALRLIFRRNRAESRTA